MTKQVLISIRGMQLLPDSIEMEEPVEIVTAGEYYFQNGRHFIKYEEMIEGFDETTQNMIKVKPDGVEVRKKGVANVHMVFEENKKNLTYYQTPYGVLQMGISATKVDVSESEENLDISVDYALEVNDEHVADCNIMINVKPQGAKDFTLMTH
ncbi:MAG: DUF1934 domain-containing protein [Lachnospiraceae bacterium]|jgi:uncharacterized beta-barrel protein YwiB (DUF1934 family)